MISASAPEPDANISELNNKRETNLGKQFQLDIPWSPQMYFTVRGAENVHIYLWILKDLSWTQKWTVCSWIFGLSAISWCLVLVYHAVEDRNYNEIYMLFGMILWLAANFVWMAGMMLYYLVTFKRFRVTSYYSMLKGKCFRMTTGLFCKKLQV
jgi:hypothetical protein